MSDHFYVLRKEAARSSKRSSPFSEVFIWGSTPRACRGGCHRDGFKGPFLDPQILVSGTVHPKIGLPDDIFVFPIALSPRP